jgi:hypothetical protein
VVLLGLLCSCWISAKDIGEGVNTYESGCVGTYDDAWWAVALALEGLTVGPKPGSRLGCIIVDGPGPGELWWLQDLDFGLPEY